MRQQTLTIGGISLRLISAHDEFWSSAERCYGGFLHSDDKEPQDSLEVALVPASEVPSAEHGPATGKFSRRNGSLHLQHGRGVAEWDVASGVARVRQADTDFKGVVPRPEYLCDTLLCAMVVHRLAADGGSLVHSASLVRNGGGYLFVGASGAGKSTVARLSADQAEVFSDDVSLVRLAGQGASIHGTPFLGEYQVATADHSAPLEAICFLRQASENRLTPVSRGFAVRQLLCAMLLPQDTEATEAVLRLAAELPQRVPCYELEFRPDPSFWRCIDERDIPRPE